MRVLTFLHSFEPGGVERVALRLVRRWRAIGVDAPLFMGREDGPLRDECARDLAYETPAQPRLGTAWRETIWMIVQLPRIIRQTRPDVLFVAGSTYTVVAVAMTLLLGRQCPPIVTKLSNDLARRDLPLVARLGWRLWLRAQARVARTWVIMDEAIADDLPRAMRNRVQVVHDPAIGDAQIRNRTDQRTNPDRRFVAIGRLAAQKDYPLMLRAFARGAFPGDTLTIYGDGPERRALERLALSLELGARVFFAGHVADAAARLDDHDVLLLSSRYEGIPAVLIEALAAGLSLIATNSGVGVRSLLSDGEFGTLVPRDEAALAAAIGSAPLPAGSSAALHEHLRRFTLERSALTYVAVFAAATGSAPAALPPRFHLKDFA